MPSASIGHSHFPTESGTGKSLDFPEMIVFKNSLKTPWLRESQLPPTDHVMEKVKAAWDHEEWEGEVSHKKIQIQQKQ